MAELADNGLNRKIQDSAVVGKEVDAIEASIAELRNAYDQYFLGIERKPPNTEHAELKRRLQRLKGAYVRQTALKFRVNALQSKFLTYERLWTRTLQEIEDGTYRRDLYKAKKRLAKALPKAEQQKPEPKAAEGIAGALDSIEVDADVEFEAAAPAPQARPAIAPKAAAAPGQQPRPAAGAVPAAKPVTGATPAAKPVTGATPAARPVTGATPAAKPITGATPAARPITGASPAAKSPPSPAVAVRPVGTGGEQALSDTKLRQVYDAYLSAKKKCREDVSSLSFDSVAANLRKQVPELMRKSGAKGVEFKVVIKDGKAVLRAVPK